MIFLAHFTGIPHHAEEAQSVLALWPLLLLALQLIVVIVRQRTRQVLRLVAGGLREARPFFGALLAMGCVYALVQVTQAAPSRPPVKGVEVLRGPSAQVLGTLVTNAQGVQELRGVRQQLLGTYDPHRNETRDATRRLVGTGNLLTSLLR